MHIRRLIGEMFVLIALTVACNNQPATVTIPPFITPPKPSPTSTFTSTPTATETPSPTPSYTEIPSLTPSLLQPVSATSLAANNTLLLETQTRVIHCECNGKYGKVLIIVKFKNGASPYNISGQMPVNSDTAEFDVPLGSTVHLIITSSDGLRWEGDVDIPSTCTPREGQCDNPEPTPTPVPKTQCNDGKDNDFDGKIDYPKDKGCSSSADNSEWPPWGN